METATSLQHPITHLQQWRGLVTTVLSLSFSEGLSGDVLEQLGEQYRALLSDPRHCESALLEAHAAVVGMTLRLKFPALSPSLAPGGTLILSSKGRWPGSRCPNPHEQLESGLLFFLLGRALDRSDLVEAAHSVASWWWPLRHFPSLYSREEDFNPSALVALETLLFRAAGLQERSLGSDESYFRLLAMWLERLGPARSRAQPQPVGLLATEHAAVTLSGDQTGLGVYRREDVVVAAYGPHLPPLGDCHAFGIENPLTASGLRYESTLHGCELSGTVRCANQEWLEVEQSLLGDRLELRVRRSCTSETPLSMAFFIRALTCHAGGSEIHPQSLDKYAGSTEQVVFSGERGSLTISGPDSGMEIVPLSGGERFWGATYLLAYPLASSTAVVPWTIS